MSKIDQLLSEGRELWLNRLFNQPLREGFKLAFDRLLEAFYPMPQILPQYHAQ